MERGKSPWQGSLPFFLIPSVNHSVPRPHPQWTVSCCSTSLNNCRQQLEDQSGKVSIQYMMLDLCIAEMDWLSVLTPPRKTSQVFVCFVFVLTHLFVYCFWWSIIQAHLQGTAHARCWKKRKEEKESWICYSTVGSQAPWQPGWLPQEWAGYYRGYFCG